MPSLFKKCSTGDINRSPERNVVYSYTPHHQGGGHRLIVPPTWPPGWLIDLSTPSLFWLIESNRSSWRASCLTAANPIYSVCLHHRRRKSDGLGGGEDIWSCWWVFEWEAQGLGKPCSFWQTLCKFKGKDDQVVFRGVLQRMAGPVII